MVNFGLLALGVSALQQALYTIGYQGAQISDLIDALRAAGVRCLVDVREAPISRKRDFAKSRLAAHLQDAQIGYRHVRALGNPKAGRDAARAGDVETYRTIFGQHMESLKAREAVQQIAELAATERACLLCLERDPRQCHRSIVADHITALNGQETKHLFADTASDQGKLF